MQVAEVIEERGNYYIIFRSGHFEVLDLFDQLCYYDFILRSCQNFIDEAMALDYKLSSCSLPFDLIYKEPPY